MPQKSGIPDQVRDDECRKPDRLQPFHHRHPELVSGSMACRLLRRGIEREIRPWMLKQVQHDVILNDSPPPQSRHRRKIGLSYIIRLCQFCIRLFHLVDKSDDGPACGGGHGEACWARSALLKAPIGPRNRLNFPELWNGHALLAPTSLRDPGCDDARRQGRFHSETDAPSIIILPRAHSIHRRNNSLHRNIIENK